MSAMRLACTAIGSVVLATALTIGAGSIAGATVSLVIGGSTPTVAPGGSSVYYVDILNNAAAVTDSTTVTLTAPPHATFTSSSISMVAGNQAGGSTSLGARSCTLSALNTVLTCPTGTVTIPSGTASNAGYIGLTVPFAVDSSAPPQTTISGGVVTMDAGPGASIPASSTALSYKTASIPLIVNTGPAPTITPGASGTMYYTLLNAANGPQTDSTTLVFTAPSGATFTSTSLPVDIGQQSGSMSPGTDLACVASNANTVLTCNTGTITIPGLNSALDPSQPRDGYYRVSIPFLASAQVAPGTTSSDGSVQATAGPAKAIPASTAILSYSVATDIPVPATGILFWIASLVALFLLIAAGWARRERIINKDE